MPDERIYCPNCRITLTYTVPGKTADATERCCPFCGGKTTTLGASQTPVIGTPLPPEKEEAA